MTDDEEEQGGRIFFSNIGRSMEVEDEIVLVSVGIDIGSSTSHLAFSRIVLERLDTRYMVVERTLLHQSDVLLTPYRGEDEIDADVLGATPSGVETTVPLFDLAAIAVRTGDTASTGIDAAGIAELRRRHCVKSYFWDPLGNGPCADAVADLTSRPAGQMYALLAGAAFRHPVAYVEHRLAHLNMTERWWVGRGLIDNWPPSGSQPNRIGLGNPGRAASWWIDAAHPLADTPLGWPVVWLTLALAGLVEALRRSPAPARDVALALLVSAVSLEASFAAVSIAADLRYHLWSMMAAGLGVALLWTEARPPPRLLFVGGAALVLVVASGIAARAILPPAPSDYDAMLAG